jgi:hypothetical protein
MSVKSQKLTWRECLLLAQSGYSPICSCRISANSGQELQAGSKKVPSTRKALEFVRSTIGKLQTGARHQIGYDP